jgi:hypothetical protein
MHQDIVYVEVGKAIELIQLVDGLFKAVLSLVFPGKKFNGVAQASPLDKIDTVICDMV